MTLTHQLHWTLNQLKKYWDMTWQVAPQLMRINIVILLIPTISRALKQSLTIVGNVYRITHS